MFLLGNNGDQGINKHWGCAREKTNPSQWPKQKNSSKSTWGCTWRTIEQIWEYPAFPVLPRRFDYALRDTRNASSSDKGPPRAQIEPCAQYTTANPPAAQYPFLHIQVISLPYIFYLVLGWGWGCWVKSCLDRVGSGCAVYTGDVMSKKK